LRLTVYTDYALRVMMYLAVKHKSGELSTIDDIVAAYKISRAHVAKIVYDLGVNGMIVTVRGRMGGIKLACAPEDISIGAIVRSTEKDFAVVECHDANALVDCAILPFCNLKSGFKRAIDAFLSELDQMTLAASIKSMSSAAGALGLAGVQPVKVALPKSRAKPSDAAPAPKRRAAAAPKRAAKKTAAK
jgi:Rrf2 family nitric oxide-sensitive transcriptional repressor